MKDLADIAVEPLLALSLARSTGLPAQVAVDGPGRVAAGGDRADGDIRTGHRIAAPIHAGELTGILLVHLQQAPLRADLGDQLLAQEI